MTRYALLLLLGIDAFTTLYGCSDDASTPAAVECDVDSGNTCATTANAGTGSAAAAPTASSGSTGSGAGTSDVDGGTGSGDTTTLDGAGNVLPVNTSDSGGGTGNVLPNG